MLSFYIKINGQKFTHMDLTINAGSHAVDYFVTCPRAARRVTALPVWHRISAFELSRFAGQVALRRLCSCQRR